MHQSESLLTEILGLLQDLNANVVECQSQVDEVRSELADVRASLQHVVDTAFPGALLEDHATHHKKFDRPSLLRRFLTKIAEYT